MTDGTVAGTGLLKDLNPGGGGTSVARRIVVGNKLYLQTYTPELLWVSDGTEAGTQPVELGELSSIDQTIALDNKLFLDASHPDTGNELWVLDTTSDELTLVDDIVPGPEGSNPRSLRTVAGRLWFSITDMEIGQDELWIVNEDHTKASKKQSAELARLEVLQQVELNGEWFFIGFGRALRP